MFVGAYFRTRSIHTPFSPCVRLIISLRRSLHLCECLWLSFLERVFGGFVMFESAFLRTRSIHTPFSPVICVRLISVHGCFTAVTARHEPSRTVAVRANLTTRLGSSRFANFFRGRCTLPEVHFRYPFSRHDFRCDGRDSR